MTQSKILFVEAPYSYGKGNVVVGKYFPLGIGYLAAYLRRSGCQVKIVQPANEGNFNNKLTELLKDYRPDLVGISVMTPTFPKAVALCRLVKENSNAYTAIGGHHISAVGIEVLEQSDDIDYAVIGEGEITLLELVKEMETISPDFSRIDGLVWRDSNGSICQNKARKFIKDLDVLPFPARDLVDLSKFRLHSYIDFGKKSATMITSRGCPFKCMFCSSHLTMGSSYRFRSAENVLAEVEEITGRYDIDHIVFEDDTMTLKRDRMEAICEGLIRTPNKLSWYCLSRVDSMDRELALLMKKAGCRMVNFGIESGSPVILKKIKKKISVQKAVEAVRACTQVGLRTQCTFIVGFPFDTGRTMEMTLEAAQQISPTIAIFFPLTPYPGTEVYEKFLDSNLHPKNVTSWADFLMTSNDSGISVNAQFSGHEIKKIANRWNLKFYFRARQVFNIAKSIKSWNEMKNISKGFLYLVRKALP